MKEQMTKDEGTTKKQKERTFNKIMRSPYVTLLGIILSFTGILCSIFQINPIVICCVLGFLALYLIFITYYLLKTYFSVFRIRDNLAKNFDTKLKKALDETADILYAADEVLAQLQREGCTDSAFKNAMENVCQPIKEMLANWLGECAVCIKQICTDAVMDSDFSEWSTQTIARACFNRADRSRDDLQRQSISCNTSFFEILSKRLTIWSSGNLNETIEAMKSLRGEYKNPDANFQNFYHSTIVVPICRNVERVSPKIKEYKTDLQIKGIHFLGFLCVDSLETFEKENQNFMEAMKITRMFGNYVYRLLEERLVQQLK